MLQFIPSKQYVSLCGRSFLRNLHPCALHLRKINKNLPSRNIPNPAQKIGRIKSVDVLRGAIVILMAIDHVRVYSGLPAGGPHPGIFFTRWITHFCAPGFVFFAGTAAFLYGVKLKKKNALSQFLLSRGLLFIFLEL